MARIKDFQKLMKDLYFEQDKRRGPNKTFIKLVEEVGELAEAILTEEKSKIREEIADIVAWIASLANLYGMDLLEVSYEKYPNECPKCRSNPCNCENK